MKIFAEDYQTAPMFRAIAERFGADAAEEIYERSEHILAADLELPLPLPTEPAPEPIQPWAAVTNAQNEISKQVEFIRTCAYAAGVEDGRADGRKEGHKDGWFECLARSSS